MNKTIPLLTILALSSASAVLGQQAGANPPSTGGVVLTADTFRDLQLRNIGPCATPGRVADIAVDPRNRSVWYIATASSGLWKTTNRGDTWRPIFDQGGSYSLGCVTLDPKNSDIVWLGTGENQALRSVSFGDGLYKSTDAGQTWKRVGLPNSEHIQKILIDPRNSDIVYVAAQGPLWAPGGDRGLYKTTDGGATWKPVLQISENTGVTDAAFDPRNPDIIYASSYQRRRNVGVLIGGGPESAIFKTADAGATWVKLTNGLPDVDLGRIALAVSPQKPDVVYAAVTAAMRQSGFYRSEDGGVTWQRQRDYEMVDPQYYGELYADPFKFDKVYIIDSTTQLTEDGGKTIRPVNWQVHVDHHALDLDPTDPNHLITGNDGGLYETYDGGRTWRHFTSLPTMQFYHVAVDNALPFYNVYGGAQDNGSIGGPSRSINRVGIRTSDWGEFGGGDGMQPRVDPADPDTIYTMSQNGALTRFDKRTSASTGVRPRTPQGQRVRWNWNAPFIISPHLHTRLYLAGSMLFRSDDRGNTWTNVSPDLTRQIDRDALLVMGRIWGSNAVTRNRFTTELGVSTALSESPLKQGLLYVGTDDGLVQITTDGGQNWSKIESIPGVPRQTTVSDLLASRHDTNTFYAAFNNYQRGDFKPYLLKSTDQGRSWTSIASDLPSRNFVWSIIEDRENKNLLFLGTEFGLFVTLDGGQHWVQLKGGVPTIAFRDLEIQERESDLVCATFGRGFYILDDYSPLRKLTPDTLAKEGMLLPLRNPYLYYEATFLRDVWGNYTMPNPAFGAELTYYLRNDVPTEGGTLVVTIADVAGKEVRRLNAERSAGLHRLNWDLREAPPAGAGRGRGTDPGDGLFEQDEQDVAEAEAEPASEEAQELQQVGGGATTNQSGAAIGAGGVQEPQRGAAGGGRGARGGRGGRGFGGGRGGGPLVKPGKFTASLNKVVNGQTTPLGEPQTFEVVPLPGVHLPVTGTTQQ